MDRSTGCGEAWCGGAATSFGASSPRQHALKEKKVANILKFTIIESAKLGTSSDCSYLNFGNI
jgi:hypothetical protein